MRPELAKAVPRFTVSGMDGSERLQCFESQAARPIIFLCNAVEDFDDGSIIAFREQIFGSLLESDHRDPQNATNKDKSPITIPNISPALEDS